MSTALFKITATPTSDNNIFYTCKITSQVQKYMCFVSGFSFILPPNPKGLVV